MPVIYDTELSRRNTMNRFLRMNHINTIHTKFQRCRQILRCVAYLDAHLHTVTRFMQVLSRHNPLPFRRIPRITGKEVHVVYREMRFVCSILVIAVRHEEDVLLEVFLHRKPRSATKAETMALPGRMEPKSFVHPYL